jgi:hypothetical protein
VFKWLLGAKGDTGDDPSAGSDPTVDDQKEIVDMLIGRAAARVQLQLADAESLATKALGVLAVDAGAIALMVSVHEDLYFLWPIPTAALGVVAAGLLWAVYPTKLDSGPDIGDFYDAFGGGFELATKQQMLADMLKTIENNETNRRNTMRNWVYKRCFVLLVISLLGAVAVALTGPGVQ